MLHILCILPYFCIFRLEWCQRHETNLFPAGNIFISISPALIHPFLRTDRQRCSPSSHGRASLRDCPSGAWEQPLYWSRHSWNVQNIPFHAIKHRKRRRMRFPPAKCIVIQARIDLNIIITLQSGFREVGGFLGLYFMNKIYYTPEMVIRARVLMYIEYNHCLECIAETIVIIQILHMKVVYRFTKLRFGVFVKRQDTRNSWATGMWEVKCDIVENLSPQINIVHDGRTQLDDTVNIEQGSIPPNLHTFDGDKMFAFVIAQSLDVSIRPPSGAQTSWRGQLLHVPSVRVWAFLLLLLVASLTTCRVSFCPQSTGW